MSELLNFFCCTRLKDFVSTPKTHTYKPEVLIPAPIPSERSSFTSSNTSLIKTLLEQRISKAPKPVNNNVLKNQEKSLNKKTYLRFWTEEEDATLQSLFQRYGGKWEMIAKKMGKTANQCSHRWRKIKPDEMKKRRLWSKEEDDALLNLVSKYGKDWNLIVKKLPGRNRKQVRDRYNNTLDPKLRKEDWTPQEDQLILKLYQENGAKWAFIADRLKGRSEIMVKNHFNNHLKKKALDSCAESDGQKDFSEKESTNLKDEIQSTKCSTNNTDIIKYLDNLNLLLNPSNLSLYAMKNDEKEDKIIRNSLNLKQIDRASLYPHEIKFSSGSDTINKSPHLYESEKSILNSLKNINIHDEKISEGERKNFSHDYQSIIEVSENKLKD